MTNKIQHAEPTDVKSITDYLNQFFELNVEGIASRPEGISLEEVVLSIPKAGEQTDKLCLIAKENETVVGSLMFARRKNIEYRHCGEFGMSVLPDYQNQSIGTRLLSEMEAWAKQHDILKIELSVWSNNHVAIQLYQRSGYLVEGTRSRSVMRNGKSHDLVLMGKWIGK